jgi:hypothetical protein
MNMLLEEVEDTEEDKSNNAPPLIQMMDPREILESCFGTDVNPVASEEEDLSLRESIARNGVQIPITAGRIKGKGKCRVVKGTRRHRVALELNIPELPVELKEYASLEEMRQDAIEDNLERRQLSKPARAKLAYTLWQSYDSAADKKEKSSHGLTPRKRAAIAGGLSEGSLAAYRSVQDSGDVELIAGLESGDLSIDAAYRKMKQGFDGGTSLGVRKDIAARNKRFMAELDEIAKSVKKISGAATQAAVVRRELDKIGKSDRQRIVKKMKAVTRAIAEAEDEGVLSALRMALSGETGDAEIAGIEFADAGTTESDVTNTDKDDGLDAADIADAAGYDTDTPDDIS